MMTEFVVNTYEQYEVALQTLERRFLRTMNGIHERYTVRMREEAWGDPAKADAIRAEWDAEVDAATAAYKQTVAAVPKPPKEAR